MKTTSTTALLVKLGIAALAGYFYSKSKYQAKSLEVNSNTEEGGEVNTDGVNGFGNAATGGAIKVLPGTAHTVIATPSPGYKFIAWSEDNEPIARPGQLFSRNRSFRFTMPLRNVKINAFFQKEQLTDPYYSVTLNAKIL